MGRFTDLKRKSFQLVYNEDEDKLLVELSEKVNRSKNATLKMMIRYGHLYFVKGEKMPERVREVA